MGGFFPENGAMTSQSSALIEECLMQSLACPAVDAENPNSSSRLPLGLPRAALA